MRLKPNRDGSFFHPFEVVFSGYSGSGKTTLISKLAESLCERFDIGYYKRDSHRFEMDKEGKDTWTLKQSGARSIFINDSRSWAFLSEGEVDQVLVSSHFLNSDILFVEGHKRSKLPKLLVMSSETKEKTLADLRMGEISNVSALIGEEKEDPCNGRYPYFQRDEIAAITGFIAGLFEQKKPKKLYGLVLTGGKSQRMKEDKGNLVYHGRDQIAHTADLLRPWCDEVYVSCRQEQESLSFLRGHKLVPDNFPSLGPSSGILSAQAAFPESAWLVVGCDLPYLDAGTLEKLVKNRNPHKLATCFLNPSRGWPEPLCAIYEPKSHIQIMNYFARGKPCPRKVLFNSNIKSLALENKNALNNVNTPEERQKALKHFGAKGGIHAG